MSLDNTVTVAGNIVHEPEVSFLDSGKAKLSFSVAVNREINGEKYVSYFDCTVWGKLAENAGNSLKKGDRVVVFGTLKQQTYETKEGQKRSQVEVVVSDLGPSLLWSTVTVNKNS